MKRILFVDDDRLSLDGLRLRLHRLCGNWEMSFLDSGCAALEELERHPADVVVTDLLMPCMDGAQLLRTVSERWPQAIRIVLSGYADLEQAMRLVPFAHQYLSKPCEAQKLENVIQRCLHLHALLQNPELRAVVGRIRTLPAMPRVYARLRTVLANDNTTVHEVAAIVADDAAIAAKVLQLVNSAFFRSARRITGIDQAVTHLGFAAIRNMTLSAEVFSQWPDAGAAGGLDLGRLQAHVHAMASAARSLSAKTSIADDVLLAGLLHDIGYWVLAQECAADLGRSIQLAAQERIPLHEAETRVMGASHAEIGAYLLGIWGLPYPVIEAVAYHHAPHMVQQSEFDVLAALAVAHALLPSDDASVFDADLVPDSKVDGDYLASLDAPFDWDEATRRVALSLESTEGCS